MSLESFFSDISAIETNAGKTAEEELSSISVSKKRKGETAPMAPSTKRTKVISFGPTDESSEPTKVNTLATQVTPIAKIASETSLNQNTRVKVHVETLVPSLSASSSSASSSTFSSNSSSTVHGFNATHNTLPTTKPEISDRPQYGAEWYSKGKSKKDQNNAPKAKRAPLRSAGGEVWKDETLNEWPENDFRMFVGNLGSEVNPAVLKQTFASKFPSVAMARVVYDKRTSKSKGFGFVSFLDYRECAQALRTMNGTYIGSTPVMLKVSKWKDRNVKGKGRGGKRGYEKRRR
jgi:hypothetical protein